MELACGSWCGGVIPGDSLQSSAHPFGAGAFTCKDSVELPQLHSADGCLDLGETPVVTNQHVLVCAPLPVVTQQSEPFGDVRVVCKRNTTLAHRDVLGGGEAEHRGPAECSNGHPTEDGACSLSSVLQNEQTVICACLHDLVNFSRLAAIVHNDDGLGLTCGESGYFGWIQIE